MKLVYATLTVITFLAITSFITENVLTNVVPPRKLSSTIPVCTTGVCKVPSRSAALRSSVSNNAAVAPGAGTADMALIKGGSFQMGSADFPDAKPVHAVSVNSFWIDTHEVTNDQFEKFVRATRYVTVAERPLNSKDYPGVPADKLVPGSAVFTPPTQPVSLENPLAWWQYVSGSQLAASAGTEK